MVEVKITEDIKIGGNNPCFIIAEVGQNHQGDIEIAKKLIKAAKVSGFNFPVVRRMFLFVPKQETSKYISLHFCFLDFN